MTDVETPVRRTGLATRILLFFSENPTEELTYDLIMRKYDVSRKTAQNVLDDLVDRGLIERVHVIRKGRGA